MIDVATDLPAVIGVIGAGTMGAGIAQLAAQTGARTLLHDPIPEALERGIAGIGAALDKLASREKITTEEAEAIKARIEPAATLEELAAATFVIEAAPERIELKLELFGKLAEIVAPDAVFATNTSSLSVTEIAAGTPGPERVVGFHFFNPAPVMKLVEVVAGQASSDEALATAHAVGEAMGKTTIDAADVAGFLVNRCNRPYSLEALRLLSERVATVEQIDRITRLGGGFRMGPFELMDLIGIETNLAVVESLYRASYGEPRYQPSPIQARMVASGRLGRKSASGWYDYSSGTTGYRPTDPDPLILGGGDERLIVITGTLPIAQELRRSATRDGWDVRDQPDPDGAEPWLTVDCAGTAATAASTPVDQAWHGPRARLLYDGSLAVTDPTAVGFHFLPPFRQCKLAELATTPSTPLLAIERAEEFFASVGCHCEHVSDAPGLALGRIVAQLINEAAFLIGEGNGSPEDVDAGMRLGVNHPRGPVEWSAMIGLEHVVSILDALHREHGEPRYRVAPLLRRRAALGAPGLADLPDS
ncbi:MAG: 3-hydroxyacyl-CoA dehydrogenase NAD-binding domain-containing protein [Solirubrobacteraceae bacterium]